METGFRGPRKPSPTGPAEVVVEIASAHDIVVVRERGRALAIALGFSGSDPTLIATAISEIARPVVDQGCRGQIAVTPEVIGGRARIVIVARVERSVLSPWPDHAPTEDPDRARHFEWGLAGVGRLMDAFEVSCRPGSSTTVTAWKWRT